MVKRFKLRISRVLNSFQTCRSKDLPENPHRPFFIPNPPKPATFHLHFPTTPPPPPPPTSIRRHVSSAIASVGCGCRSRPHRRPTSSPTPPHPPSDFQWRKDEKWHVVARISNPNISDNSSDDDIYTETTAMKKQQQKQMNTMKRRKKKNHRSRVRISTSSADHGGWFSSDGREDEYDDDETETLVSSSRTFSDDPGLQTIQEQQQEKNTASKRRTKAARRRRRDQVGVAKVKESVAVVKRSEDPYGDFKRSMVEMIVEKEMYGEDELEQLLQCLLSLNSRAHHPAIVRAFSEIWNALFSTSSSSPNPNPSTTNNNGGGGGISISSLMI